MMTSTERKEKFMKDLKKLLKRHNATLELTDYSSYAHSDIVLEVLLPVEYNEDGTLVNEYVYFKLPHYLHGDS